MKKHGYLVFVSFAFVLLAACGSPKPAPVTVAPPAPKLPTDQDRLEKYQQCWGYYNEKKLDQLKDCYAASAVSQQSDGAGSTINGVDAIMAATQAFIKSVPDVHGDQQLILVNGTHVASINLMKGTNSGPLAGANGKETPATNKSFAMLMGHTVDFAPDVLKVVTEMDVMDNGTFASQLGLSKQKVRGAPAATASPEIVLAKNDAIEKANVDAENAQLAAWNKHDKAGVQGYVADNVVVHVMSDAQDSTKKQSDQMDASYWKGFSDAHIATDAVWSAGDYVVLTGKFEGTNDGAVPMMGIRKKTGKKVSVPFFEVDKFAGGKLTETWLFFDGMQFATQLGLAGK